MTLATQTGLFVLVTGAGASRELGFDNKPLPLMRDWSTELVHRLSAIVPEAPQAVRLAGELDGIEFETRLGEFLAWQRSLPLARTILNLGIEEGRDTDIRHWFDVSEQRAQVVTDGIHETLFDLFGQGRIANVAARDAYGALLDALPGAADRLVVATTNYDVAAEWALSELDLRPFWGQDQQIIGSSYLRPEGMCRRRDVGNVPVLHLHGCVGWYREENRIRIDPSASRYSRDLGQPAVLLPDPNKDPTADPTTSALWTEFEEALRRADRILVVGHSLHDPALVNALRATDLHSRIAIAVHADGQSPEEQTLAWQHFRGVLPDSVLLPLTFGPKMLNESADGQRSREALDAWWRDAQPTWTPKVG
jgi:hypothetical protein